MITLIYFIVTLITTHEMSWLPVFIDCIITIIFIYLYFFDDTSNASGIAGILMGVAVFAAYKHFFALSVSFWWIFISPIYLLCLGFIPGSAFITHHFLEKYGLAEFGTGAFIFAVITTLFSIVMYVIIIHEAVNNKKNQN